MGARLESFSKSRILNGLPCVLLFQGAQERKMELYLGGGHTALFDDEDTQKVLQHKWFYSRATHTDKVYAVANPGIKMHRLVMGNPDSDVDHINGNGLDNRKANLRLATSSQNKANGRRYRCGSSGGYKGVYYVKERGDFRAIVRVKGRNIHLGYHGTAQAAALAYDAAARRYFGEFATTNF